MFLLDNSSFSAPPPPLLIIIAQSLITIEAYQNLKYPNNDGRVHLPCNLFDNQHWQPMASITELQRFLGRIVAYSAGDACGTFLSGIAKLN